MKSFSKFILEGATTPADPTTLHGFDLDETLFSHDPKKLTIHVVNSHTGERVATLTNTEYNHHKLPPDHHYDYESFRSPEVFHQSAKPIRPMIAKMKAIHKAGGKVEIITARGDFDSKEKFGKELGRYGIDIDKIHVRRSGNLNPRGSASVNKANMISKLILKNGYKRVHLYDDSTPNLEHFLKLKEKHPEVEFHAHHVEHNPQTHEVKVTSQSA